MQENDGKGRVGGLKRAGGKVGKEGRGGRCEGKSWKWEGEGMEEGDNDCGGREGGRKEVARAWYHQV